MIDSVGESVLTQTYDPYGNPYASSGAGETHLGFTGEVVDPGGLVYLRARYYQPGMGRFLSADPSRAERNLYGYGGANPVMFADPSGHQFEDCQGPRCHWIGDCHGDWFCENYGFHIAQRARYLDRVGEYPYSIYPMFQGCIEPWGDMSNPPEWQGPWEPGQEQCRGYVCVDIIRDVYETVGIDINTMTEGRAHSAEAYYDYLWSRGEFRYGDDFPYLAGEVVILYDRELYDRTMAGEIPCDETPEGLPGQGCLNRRRDMAGVTTVQSLFVAATLLPR